MVFCSKCGIFIPECPDVPIPVLNKKPVCNDCFEENRGVETWE